MRLFLILSFCWQFCNLASAQSPCTDRISDQACDYYLCKSEELGCSNQDYPAKFGYKLCERYLESQDQASPELQAWLPEVRLCLQQKLETLPKTSCENLESLAFATHVDCYVQTGFCQLSKRDKAWLIKKTSWQMLYPISLRTAFAIEHACHQLMD